MKKTILLATVLFGAVAASQAGLRLSFGFTIPLGAPPVYASPPPVYQAPAPVYQAPAPVYQAPPPAVVYAAPPVVYAPPVYAPAPGIYLGFGTGWGGAYRHGSYGPRYYGGWGHPYGYWRGGGRGHYGGHR